MPKKTSFFANACTAVCKKQEGVVVNSDCCQLVRKSKWQMVQCSCNCINCLEQLS